MEDKDFNQWKAWYKNKKFKEDKGIVGIAYRTIVVPTYKAEAVRRDPPSPKAIKWYKDLISYGFGNALPKGMKPQTGREYGLANAIMANAQYNATGGRYGVPRKKSKGEKNNEK